MAFGFVYGIVFFSCVFAFVIYNMGAFVSCSCSLCGVSTSDFYRLASSCVQLEVDFSSLE